jgi:hypothetical protein
MSAEIEWLDKMLRKTDLSEKLNKSEGKCMVAKETGSPD